MGNTISQLWPSLRTESTTCTSFVDEARDINMQHSNVNVAGGNQTFVVNHTVIHVIEARAEDAMKLIRKKVDLAKLPSIQQDTYARRADHTGLWFLDTPQFTSWWEGDMRILWVTGIPGAGKSHVAACAINHGLEKVEVGATNISVCYVYFQYSDPKPTVVILRSLVRQQAEQCPRGAEFVAATIKKREEKGMELSQADCIDLLKHMIALCDESFYYFDGLDESPLDAQCDFLKVCSEIGAKVCIFSRPLEAMQHHLEKSMPGGVTFMELKAQDADIDLLINQKIESTPQLALLLGTNKAFQSELAAKVKENAGGMLLHAALQLEALRYSTSIANIRSKLNQFPRGLHAMYEESMERINDQPEDMAELGRKVLLWVTYAERQLKVAALQEALSVNTDTENVDEDNIPPPSQIVSACCGLVTATSDFELRLMHWTTKGAVMRLLQVWYPHPFSVLATSCMSWLARPSARPLGVPVPGCRADLYLSQSFDAHAHTHLPEYLRAGLESPNSPPALLQQTLAFIHHPELSKHIGKWVSYDLYIHALAQPLHVAAFWGIPTLLKTLVDDHSMNPNASSWHKDGYEPATPVGIAIAMGHTAAVTYLLSLPTIDLNKPSLSKMQMSPLMVAAQAQDLSALDLLLGHDVADTVDVNAQSAWPSGMTALMYAVGNPGAVSRLLRAPGIDVNRVDYNGQCALHHAIECVGKWRHTFLESKLDQFEEDVLRILAVDGVSVNLRDPTNARATPLCLAIEGGHPALALEILKVKGLDVNARDWHLNHCAFTVAMCEGQYEVALRILEMEKFELGDDWDEGRVHRYLTLAVIQRGDPTGAECELLMAIAAKVGELRKLQGLPSYMPLQLKRHSSCSW